MPREQLPDHDPQGVKIDAEVAGAAIGDLGRDIAWLGVHDSRDGAATPILRACRAEVDELDVATVPQHHVLRRKVTMHDPQRPPRCIGSLVGVGERLGQGRANRYRLSPGDSVPDSSRASPHLAKTTPFDILDNDVGLSPRIDSSLQNLRNTWMVELRLNARFIEKARQERAVRSVVTSDDLHDAGSLGPLDGTRAC